MKKKYELENKPLGGPREKDCAQNWWKSSRRALWAECRTGQMRNTKKTNEARQENIRGLVPSNIIDILWLQIVLYVH